MALQQSSIQILPALVGKTLNPARDGRCEMGRFGAFASSLARGLGAEKYHRAVQPLAAYGAFCRERAPGGALFQQEHLFVQIRLFFAMLSSWEGGAPLQSQTEMESAIALISMRIAPMTPRICTLRT